MTSTSENCVSCFPLSTSKSEKDDIKPVIGTPTGFQHVTHVGWGSSESFEYEDSKKESPKSQVQGQALVIQEIKAINLGQPNQRKFKRKAPIPPQKFMESSYETSIQIKTETNQPISHTKPVKKKPVPTPRYLKNQPFDFKGEDEAALLPFLEKAGVNQKLLENRETKAMILEFIQHNNVLERIKSEQTQPPVPKRSSQPSMEKQTDG